jgi:hypothetical protein
MAEDTATAAVPRVSWGPGNQQAAWSVALAGRGNNAAPAGVAGLQARTAWNELIGYQVDRLQRIVLFLDTLRQRANNLLAHEEAGMPPTLNFEYETILDARRFDRPANYALLSITRCRGEHAHERIAEGKRPVIIIDPRAGHGPGIGGFKRDSEVGIALHHGHPTYFVMFFPLPCENQTLADVLAALRRFVEEVGARHGGQPPVLYGNCQAGWAVVLLAAQCEGLAGPTVLNGSPLSYWAGASDVNPMRLAGGLLGGSWLLHFVTDLANGRLDGAWLVQNFENLNPANALWQKYYHLLENIDTEKERFLEFERWWNGYYFLGQNEILAIVQNLFIGNRLERGEMRVDDCCYVNLRRIRKPLLIFASSGDNITPPHQALNWIPTVYSSTDDLKAAGQRIVYLLNTHVGHLGIFVSADVARQEHRAILENVERLITLAPGLYEMKINRPAADASLDERRLAVHFEERQVEQIRYDYPKAGFENVRAVSDWNEALYQGFASPWISSFGNPLGAEFQKCWHPMRSTKIAFSERLNPWMSPLAGWANAVRAQRQPAPATNAFVGAERAANMMVYQMMDGYRRLRDAWSEQLFTVLYGSR